MSDYISKEELKERLVYCRGLGRTSLEAVLKAMENTPTLDETEIIRKAFERVVQRLEEYASIWCEYNESMSKEEIAQSIVNQAKRQAIEILKEECGISE